MTITTKRHGIRAAVILAVAALTAAQSTADVAAHPRPKAAHTAAAPDVSGWEADTAQSLAVALADPALRARIRQEVLASSEADLQHLAGQVSTPAARHLHTQVRLANKRIAQAKGLDAQVGSLLRVRLGDDSMRRSLTPTRRPWVTTANTGSGRWLTAYDSSGETHRIDSRDIPDRPVYVVGVDASKATAAGMDVLTKEFAQRGLSTPAALSTTAHPAAPAGWWGTKIKTIELRDTKEPWFKGKAEAYALVTGFGRDGKVRVDTVDMPYLDYRSTVYTPNQIIVNWSHYKYQSADIVLMEGDSNTNYRALAQALVAVLLTITDQGIYIPLVTAVLNAVPDAWWTDDNDYVESWYTLDKDSTGRLDGAANNGTMTVEPHFVRPS